MNWPNLLAAILVGTAVLLLVQSLVPSVPNLHRRVAPYVLSVRLRLGQGADTATVKSLLTEDTAPAWRRAIAPVLDPLIRTVGNRLERRSDSELELAFRHAGMPARTPEEYRAAQVMSALIGGGVGVVLGLLLGRPGLMPLLGILGGVIGGARQRGRVDRAIEARKRAARVEVYTVNQLLAIQLRTGASPVAALSRVCDRNSGALIDDLREILSWIQHGMGEGEAFRRGAALAAEPSVARTLSLLAVGSERGTDLGTALLAFSRDLQDARAESVRRSSTRKRAAMLIPTIGVLAPVMLLFLAAPLPSIVLRGR